MNNSWICIDANLVIRLLINPEDKIVHQLWEQWDLENRLIAAPTLLFYEVTNALYRYLRAEMIGATAVQLALSAAQTLPIILHNDPIMHIRAFEIAERFSLPATYDAHYLALADILECEFWTSDLRLVRSVQADLPWVRAVNVEI